MGQQAQSVPAFTWSSIRHLVVRLQMQLGTEYYWAGWMQKEELLEPWKCSLEEVTPSLLFGAGVEVSPSGVKGSTSGRRKKGRHRMRRSKGICEIILCVLSL